MSEAYRGGATDDLLREIKDQRSRVDKLRRYFRDSWDAFDPWRSKAVESYEFLGNEQWSHSDLERLTRLRRPTLTLNEILAPVLFLCGLQRQQRLEIDVLPFESDDVRPAELMNGLLSHVSNRSREDEVNSEVFKDKVITGLAYKKLIVDFNDQIEGELKWIRVNPLSVFPDPNFLESGWENARFVCHAMFRDMAELIDEFPEHADTIRQKFGEWLNFGGSHQTQLWADGRGEETGDPFGSRRMFWDPETQRARVLEVWYAETVRVKVPVDVESGRVIEMDDDGVEALEQQMRGDLQMAQRFAVVKRPKRMVRVAKILDDVMLEDMPSPYGSPRFPLWPHIGHYFWKYPWGVVEYVKDPQREFNKRRSTITELVMRMPHSGFLNHDTQGADSKELVDYANGNGVVINHKGNPPQLLDPPQLDQTLVFLDRGSVEEIRRITNITPEMLGATTQKTVSGRAIEARQRSGLVVQEPLLESFQNELREEAKFTVECIPKFMSKEQAIRILGTLALRKPDDPAAETFMQVKGTPDLDKVLSGAFDAKFDIVAKAQPFEPSIQVQRWQTLLELLQTFGPQAFPPDLAAEAAKSAGLIPEDWASRIIAHNQRMMAAAQQPPPGPSGEAPPGLPPPAPGSTLQ